MKRWVGEEGVWLTIIGCVGEYDVCITLKCWVCEEMCGLSLGGVSDEGVWRMVKLIQRSTCGW